MSAPSVMVSSTFYDLRQIRSDLRQFIKDGLGYSALLSEFPSFPVDPDKDTIENCRKRVEANTDILMLVIGGRYGSIDRKTEKSITNLEYLTARRKKIPVYTFVDKQVLSILPIWKINPEADYSSVVDTTKLFQFIEDVRTKEGVWTFPFETAQDIISTLKIQFAHLFLDSLNLKYRLAGTGLPPYFDGLSPQSLKIALEKSIAWEYLLFLQIWIDEVQRRSSLIREYEEGLTIGISELVGVETAIGWIHAKLAELQGLVESANHILNGSVHIAFGEDGQPGNADLIIWNAKKLGDILEETVNWALRLRRAKVEEPFTKVITEMAKFPTLTIERLQHFPSECMEKINNILKVATPENPQRLELTLTFELSNLDGFNLAMDRSKERFNKGEY